MSKSSRSKKHIEFIDFLVENIRDKEPIEGVLDIKIITNGNKNILLLGEIHQEPNYKSGCTLVINLLNTIFKKNSTLNDKFNIDFFLELTRNPIYVYNKYNQISSQVFNTPQEPIIKHDYKNPKRGSLTNIELKNMFQIAQIRNWVEPCIMNREKIGKPETRLEGEVEKFFLNRRVCYKDVRYHWIDTNPFLDYSLAGHIINIYGLSSLVANDPTIISIEDIAMINYFKKNPKDKIEKQEDLIKILVNDKLIQKEAKKSNIKMGFLQKHFLKHKESIIKTHSNIEWSSLLFFYARFTVDAYSFCRLMKDEKDWYKNIIIYGGSGHTDNISSMLLDWDPARDRTKILDKQYRDNEKFRLLNIKFRVASKCIEHPKYKKQIEFIEQLEELKESVINRKPLQEVRAVDIDEHDISHPPLHVVRILDTDKSDIMYPRLEARVLTQDELKQLKLDEKAEGIKKKKRKTRRRIKIKRRKSRIKRRKI